MRRLVDQNQGLMEYVLQWLAKIVPVAYLTLALGARTNLAVFLWKRVDDISLHAQSSLPYNSKSPFRSNFWQESGGGARPLER